jgi:hypothetical protein
VPRVQQHLKIGRLRLEQTPSRHLVHRCLQQLLLCEDSNAQ